MTGPSPAIAPYVQTYASRTPYLTPAEFKASPTGVDSSQLVPGAGVDANTAALVEVIQQASSYADNLCYQVLAATVDMQVGAYRVFRDGTIRVPVDNTPLIAVTAVSIGGQANRMTPLTDLSGLWIQRKTVRIPVVGLAYPAPSVGPAASAGDGNVFAQVTYVNGYANTTISAAAAGDQSVHASSPLGIFAGLTMTIYDGAATEVVTVAPSYVMGSSTVPLVSPLSFAHGAGAALSAMPGAIKRAVIALTTALIKVRGAEAMSMGSIHEEPSTKEKMEPGGIEEFDLAVDLLGPFRRTT